MTTIDAECGLSDTSLKVLMTISLLIDARIQCLHTCEADQVDPMDNANKTCGKDIGQECVCSKTKLVCAV